jgi:hypothetical protein
MSTNPLFDDYPSSSSGETILSLSHAPCALSLAELGICGCLLSLYGFRVSPCNVDFCRLDHTITNFQDLMGFQWNRVAAWHRPYRRRVLGILQAKS